jgi:hypothetical protein
MREVTDIRSNPREQIMHAVEVINNSKDRLRVFEEIYRGKSPIKTAEYVASRSGLEPKRVLEIGLVFSNNQLIERKKINRKYALIKDAFFSQHKTEIIRLVKNKTAREKFYTKWNPKASASTVVINLPISKKDVSIDHITVDDIDSFEKVTEIELAPESENQPMLEETFQQGLQKILGEKGEFHDWGGEGDDLFSNRLVVNGKRLTVVFGLKGRGTKDKLTPKKLGKNGDQIQRLFRSPADVYLVQYWDQIDESVVEQMKLIATAKSYYENRHVYFGEIDGQDSLRIIKAYKGLFDNTSLPT